MKTMNEFLEEAEKSILKEDAPIVTIPAVSGAPKGSVEPGPSMVGDWKKIFDKMFYRKKKNKQG